jgi:hypothetical protein
MRGPLRYESSALQVRIREDLIPFAEWLIGGDQH